MPTSSSGQSTIASSAERRGLKVLACSKYRCEHVYERADQEIHETDSPESHPAGTV